MLHKAHLIFKSQSDLQFQDGVRAVTVSMTGTSRDALTVDSEKDFGRGISSLLFGQLAHGGGNSRNDYFGPRTCLLPRLLATLGRSRTHVFALELSVVVEGWAPYEMK